MGQPGDINDELDDDTLRGSIESSTKSGEWRDENATFGDPKLEALAKQLAEPPRSTYTERRLLELDRRAAQKERRDAVKAATADAPLADPVAGPADWRDAVAKPGSPGAPPMLAPLPAIGASPRAATSALRAARSLGTSFAMFAAAVGAQAAIAGWHPSLAFRGAIAAFATGIVWLRFGEGRTRSAAIAAGAHLIAFLSTGGASTMPEVLAAFFGTLIVMLGAVLLRSTR